VLTNTDIKRYIDTGGSACPFCAGDKFHLGAVRGGTGVCFRDITCLACNEIWREIFHLAELQTPPDPTFAAVAKP
jgi:hypothetical protein